MRHLLVIFLAVLLLTCTVNIFDNTREVLRNLGILAATNISFDEESISINTNVTTNLTVTVLPSDHSATLIWHLKETNIIRLLDNGQFTSLLEQGTAILTVVADGVSDAIEIRVAAMFPATNIEINNGDFMTSVGSRGFLTATTLPDGHTGELVWTSSNNDIFNINSINGAYTATTEGQTLVTASIGNISDTIMVTVVANPTFTRFVITTSIVTKQRFFYAVSNAAFSNRVVAAIPYVNNNSTNILLSNTFLSNHMADVLLSNNILINTNIETNESIVTISNEFVFVTNYSNSVINSTNNIATQIFQTQTNTKSNWSGENLFGWRVSYVDFSEYIFIGTILSNAILNNASFSNAMLQNANLSFATLINANLINANLSNTDLRSANLSNADLINANLSNADLSNTDLRSANLTNANLTNANLTGVLLNGDGYLYLRSQGIGGFGGNLMGIDLNNANLTNANLSFTDLTGANLMNANLSDANLSDANLRIANLSNANLSNANLSNANLENADLENAILRSANLIGATLRSATLRSANLSFANLSDANLASAFLIFANLSNANLSNATLRSATLTDASLSSANLFNANLSNANLQSANLQSANLRNANLSNTALQSANLQNANLSNANLTDAGLQNANFTGARTNGAILTGVMNADFTGAIP